VNERIVRDLIYKVRERYTRELLASDVKTIVVHPGPKSWKEVSLLRFLDPDTGEVQRQELRAQSWKALPPKGEEDDYDFTETEYHWHCNGEEEIEAVRRLIEGEFSDPGRYRLVKRGSEFGRLAEALSQGEVEASDVIRLMQLAGVNPDVVKALAASEDGGLLAEAVELQRRRDQLAELRRIVENPSSTERKHIHPQLKKMGWIFGGKYMGDAARTQLTAGEVLDIPLLRPDGSLHVVELKGAKVSELVKQHRGTAHPQVVAGQREEVPLIVGLEVHKAVGQVMNYLCQLDEDRDRILTRFKIDARRASATVLIGHPKFEKDFTKKEIASAFRIYNSHHARIEVMHYADLIESAERALALNEAVDNSISDLESNDASLDGGSGLNDESDWDSGYYSDEPPF
jgi:hypothetical protein